jgi:GT2 family glycosyltransferase
MEPRRWGAQQRTLREALRAATRVEDGGPRAPEEAGRAVPLVSVIVVCWNAADVLARCLDQLLAQDYAAYEVIVVDDGSDDATLEIAREARGEVTIVSSPRNRGCPHARNLGVLRARGELVAFVDADGFAAPDWLSRIVEAFASDMTIGGVASTVFFDANPLVINGAGGVVNRQGWAADLSMSESYETAEIASEALYPMGCGMALRRAALETVGAFDDRMLNYYDDVDYGIRLWRAGYRVVVAGDAWIDHAFGQPSAPTDRKQLLCERHRMRVVLKHAPRGELGRWLLHEASALRRASFPRQKLKLEAIAWNVRHLLSMFNSRLRLRRRPAPPARLVDRSWGDGFPAGVPPVLTPRPSNATNALQTAHPGSEGQLLYGWFPAERNDGRGYRWAAVHAAALIELKAPARRLLLDFSHVPLDNGGVEVRIRRLGSPDPLAFVWATHLSWQYAERSIENHPLELAAGDYEVLFSARRSWSDPPRENRSLGFALAGMSLLETFELGPGGLDMASEDVAGQLVSGWFEPEVGDVGVYRWAGAHAAAVIRVARSASSARLIYRMAPGPIGAVAVSVCPLGSSQATLLGRIAWREGGWGEVSFPLALAAGDYVVSFDAETSWSNPGRRDPALPPEGRSLAVGVASLSFD